MDRGAASGKSVDMALSTFCANVERAGTRRVGSILLRLTGEKGGDFYLHSTSSGCVSREAPAVPPIIEVIGPGDRIRAILDGSKDGRLQFFTGGIRVRGDLKYLSELSHEMGFIKVPFWPESK
jgi:hypothetical protein